MKSLYRIWFHFRIWRLHRRADALLREAEYYKKMAKQCTHESTNCWLAAGDTRRRAVTLEARTGNN